MHPAFTGPANNASVLNLMHSIQNYNTWLMAEAVDTEKPWAGGGSQAARSRGRTPALPPLVWFGNSLDCLYAIIPSKQQRSRADG